MCVHACACQGTHVEVGGQLCEFVLSFHHVSPGVKLGSLVLVTSAFTTQLSLQPPDFHDQISGTAI